MRMFLKGAIRLKRSASRFLKAGSPWVFSNELVKIERGIAPGSWVQLEGPDGRALAYGHFNPRSLIAFRAFERGLFQSEERARNLFSGRLDAALSSRLRALRDGIESGENGRHSFRLAFGESDGLPGLVIDLYEIAGGGMAVVQCHSAGADGFVAWAREWLERKLAIRHGVTRNDLDVRKLEGVAQETTEWGAVPRDAFALEGGVRFFVDPRKGQKTGYFYDHRDNRAAFTKRVAASQGGAVLDCFSYVGGWGLQALKRDPRASLLALDVSRTALEAVRRNAEENGLAGRCETLESDFFREKDALGQRKFAAVVADPPAFTSSAKQAAEGRRAHESCFRAALSHLAPGGLAALASCSYHLAWDEFLCCVARAGWSRARALRATHVGSQAADHPVLCSLPETRYLKCVIVEELG